MKAEAEEDEEDEEPDADADVESIKFVAHPSSQEPRSGCQNQ